MISGSQALLRQKGCPPQVPALACGEMSTINRGLLKMSEAHRRLNPATYLTIESLARRLPPHTHRLCIRQCVADFREDGCGPTIRRLP